MFLTTIPGVMAGSAGSLAAIGNATAAVNVAAAAPTMGPPPPAIDPVSALLSIALGVHGGTYQAVGLVSTVVNQMFAGSIVGGSVMYDVTNVANTTLLA